MQIWPASPVKNSLVGMKATKQKILTGQLHQHNAMLLSRHKFIIILSSHLWTTMCL